MLTIVETYLDVLKASLEELYKGQRMLHKVENLQEKAKTYINIVDFKCNTYVASSQNLKGT